MNVTVFRLVVQCMLVSTIVFYLLADHLEPKSPKNSLEDSVQQKIALGTIRGRVLEADGGSALKRASLFLSMMGANLHLTAVTNEQGEFHFDQLKPGTYGLLARHDGYLRRFYGQKSVGGSKPDDFGLLRVRAGEVLDNIDITLTRSGVVEGRIWDQENQPIVGASVQLLRYNVSQGERQLYPVGSTRTDDRGRYRISDVPPDSYYLTAAFDYFGPSGHRPDAMFPRTFYPGVSKPQEAVKVHVPTGEEIRNIDFAITVGVGHSVNGRVLRADGRGAIEGAVSIYSIDSNDLMGWSPLDRGESGRFRFDGLPPGRYRVAAFSNPEGNQYTASTVVDLEGGGIEGITLVYGPGADISGRITIEGSIGVSCSDQIKISLISEGHAQWPIRIKSDLSFMISEVKEGPYRFIVNLPESCTGYVKSIRADGQEIVNEFFDVQNYRNLVGVEVLITNKGGRLSGFVKESENGNVVNGATVLLFSTEATKRAKLGSAKSCRTDQQGHFSIEGIIPGEYALCALLNHENGSEFDPSYLRIIEKNAKSLRIETGSILTESLVVHPAPATD